jgi:hypothetical protein
VANHIDSLNHLCRFLSHADTALAPAPPSLPFQARIQDGRTRLLAKPNTDFFNVIRLTRTVKGVPLELGSGHFSCNATDWQLSDFRKNRSSTICPQRRGRNTLGQVKLRPINDVPQRPVSRNSSDRCGEHPCSLSTVDCDYLAI